MNNPSKILIACLAILLFMAYGCQDEEFISPKVEINSRYVVKSLNKNDIESNTWISSRLNNIEEFLNKDINASARLIHNNDFGFTMETELVRYIEDTQTGYHSYNFPIIKWDNSSSDKIYNLLFSSRTDGEYDVFMVEYGFTSQELSEATQQSFEGTSTKYISLEFNELGMVSNTESRFAWGCEESWDWVKGTDHNGDLHGVNTNGECQVAGCNYGHYHWVMTSQNCTYYFLESTEDPFSTGGGSIWDSLPVEGGGTVSEDPNDTYVQTPVETTSLISPYAIQLIDILDITDQDMIDWIENVENFADVKDIYDYLMEEGCIFNTSTDCTANFEFAHLALEALDGDGIEDGEVDFDEEILYSDTLSNNYPCQKNIMTGAYGTNSNLAISINQTFNTSDKLHLRLKVSGNLPNDLNATTGDNPNLINCSNDVCLIDIFYNDTFLNEATDLAIAVVTLHESIHAMFLNWAKNNQINLPSNIDLDYKNLVRVYLAYVNDQDASDYASVHHSELTNFINDLKEALIAYGENNNYDLPDDFYEKLAWYGLTDTDEFDQTYPETIDHDNNSSTAEITNAERIKTLLIHQAERNAGGDDQSIQYPYPINGETITIQQKGVPCQ